MTQNVLPQLQEVIQELESQEANLSTQLTEVQAKLKGIRAVLPMFGETTVEQPDTSDDRANASAASEKKTVAKKSPTTKAKATKKAKPAAKTTQKKKATCQKKDGRAAAWQKYTLPGVNDRPMPESVQIVLATKPEEDFKIAEVMSSLFTEDMPRDQYLKARNRVSNILSGGVRDGDWFKGDRGAYRLTKAA